MAAPMTNILSMAFSVSRGTLSWQLGIDIRGPVDLLDERVGSLRKLLGRIIDLVCKGRRGTKRGNSPCGHRCSAASRCRHKSLLPDLVHSKSCSTCQDHFA